MMISKLWNDLTNSDLQNPILNLLLVICLYVCTNVCVQAGICMNAIYIIFIVACLYV